MTRERKDEATGQDREEFQSTTRKVVRGALKIAWIVPAIIAAMEMIPPSEAAMVSLARPKPLVPRMPG